MNPFYFRELPVTAPFCNRQTELKELISHARNRANVTIISPRRYGKTSIVKRVQAKLAREKVVTVYVDFFGVDSIEDIAARLAARFYANFHNVQTVLKKAMHFITSWRPVFRPDSEYGISVSVEPVVKDRGIALLEKTMSEIGAFMREHNESFLIVIDEFQEIVELRESLSIEATLRSHIQTHRNASYFFVGSRRRLLADMFNERKRPFFQSSINYVMSPLPIEEATDFIREQFLLAGKNCSEGIARRIAERVEGYPYYVQRIPYSVYEVSGKKITDDDYMKGFIKALNEEKLTYEAFLKVLAPQQIKLLSSIAENPTDKPYSSIYMSDNRLKSVGGVQGALKKLLDLDYIEKREDGMFFLTDPVFGIWLRHLKGASHSS